MKNEFVVKNNAFPKKKNNELWIESEWLHHTLIPNTSSLTGSKWGHLTKIWRTITVVYTDSAHTEADDRQPK